MSPTEISWSTPRVNRLTVVYNYTRVMHVDYLLRKKRYVTLVGRIVKFYRIQHSFENVLTVFRVEFSFGSLNACIHIRG